MSIMPGWFSFFFIVTVETLHCGISFQMVMRSHDMTSLWSK